MTLSEPYDKRNAKVQQHGLHALCNLVNSYDEAVAILFAKAGGLVAVCDGMRRELADAIVQRRACKALGLVAGNVDNLVLVAKAGAIEAVISAMRTHSSDIFVQQQGSNALGRFVDRNDDNQILAAQAGAIEAVISTMRAHPLDSISQFSCCYTLLFISSRADNQVPVVRAGAIEAVISAMRAHPSHEGVQEYGCKAEGDHRHRIRP